MEKNFDEYYEKEILPVLSGVEEIRQKYLRLFYLGMIIIVSTVLYFKSMQNGLITNLLSGGINVLIIESIVLGSIFFLYKKSVKRNGIMEKVFQYIGDFSYHVENKDGNIITDIAQNSNVGKIIMRSIGLAAIIANGQNMPEKIQKLNQYTPEVQFLNNCGIFQKFEYKKTDDKAEGIYKGINTTIEEAKLIDISRDNDDNREDESYVFRGLIISFDMNKSFNSHTVIFKDKGWFNINTNNKLQNVKLEDPIFEKYFEVYSTDQVESRYLLTTAFMERLCKIKETFNAELQASLFENKLIISISSNKDWFEVSNLFKNAENKEKVKEVIEQIKLILSMADTLKLDQKIGL